jgi:hypothetical protein
MILFTVGPSLTKTVLTFKLSRSYFEDSEAIAKPLLISLDRMIEISFFSLNLKIFSASDAFLFLIRSQTYLTFLGEIPTLLFLTTIDISYSYFLSAGAEAAAFLSAAVCP